MELVIAQVYRRGAGVFGERGVTLKYDSVELAIEFNVHDLEAVSLLCVYVRSPHHSLPELWSGVLFPCNVWMSVVLGICV